jgi:hypothetical protein
MATVIMINMQDGKGYLEFPLLDDITPQLENTYSSIGDLLPAGFSSMINLVNTATTLTSQSLTSA